MKIIFDSSTGIISIGDRNFKVATTHGSPTLDGLRGSEEDTTLGGMVLVHLHDSLHAIQVAEQIAREDAFYDEEAFGKITEDTADLIYEQLI